MDGSIAGRRRRVVVVAAVIAVQVACSGSDPLERAAAEVIDSAGIRIVVNAEPTSQGWTVAEQPSVVIGGNEADTTQQLFRVAGAAGLRDGRIVVAHGPAPMVRWYDQSGTYDFGTGRSGGGPGEFGGGEGARIAGIWPWAGDSVATWEHALRRMQLFSPDGEFGRAVVLDLPPNMSPLAYPQIVGALRDGFLAYLNPQRELGPIGEVVREPITYIRYHADGSFAGDLANLPGFTSFTRGYLAPDGSHRKVSGRPPFSRVPAAWPRDDGWFYGSGEQYEIAALDSAGVVRMLIRKPVPVQPVTAELIEQYKVTTMAGAPDDPSVRKQWQESIDTAPYPEFLPAYRRIRVDRLGMLWVQDYNLPGADSAKWSVFDQEGRWLSEVAIPESWQVLDIGADYMLVLVHDELDIERVQKHRLNRG